MSQNQERKVVLSTNRFVLREYTPDDKQQFIDYQTDPAGFVRTVTSDKQWWRLERDSWNRR